MLKNLAIQNKKKHLFIGNIALVILLALFIQFALVSYTFPLSELLTKTPLFYIDNGFHWYYMKLLNNLYETKLFSGYDPFFNAGSLGGITSDVSGHGAQILSFFIQRHLSEIQVWKVYVFFVATIGPVLPGIALYILQFKTHHIVSGLILSTFIWWTSWFHWFHVAGMVSYVFASFLSFLIISLLLRYRNSASIPKAFAISLLGGLTFFIHPLSILPIVFLISSFMVFNINELLNKKTVYFILFYFIFSTLLNIGWLNIFFQPSFSSGIISEISYQSIVKPLNILLELVGVWSQDTHGSKIYSLLFILSIIAIFRTSPNQRQTYIWPFLLAWLLIQIYAALAGAIPLLARLTQPNRFAPAGYLLLIIPSVFAIQPFKFKFKETLTIKRLLPNFAYILIVLLTTININEVFREVSYGNHGHYAAPPPQVNSQSNSAYSDFILNTFLERTNTSARILFETSLGRIHDQGHLAGYYAYTSDREFIGGPYPYKYFTGFWDGFIFGVPINTIPPEKFLNYLKLYNIGWVLAHSDKSKTYFEQFSNLTPGESFKELQFYTVSQKHTYFIQGNGIIQNRMHNHVELSNLSGHQVILKYHYFPELSQSPNIKFEPLYQMDDPIPFIKIIDPPKKLIISLMP